MLIKRKVFADLKAHLSQKEITLIVGPRQAGKTTLMLALKKYLEEKGEKTVFFNLDIETDGEYFTSQAKLIQKIQLELGSHSGFVFIDEIQRKENAGLFLKGIYDMNLPYKFIVSGSGSLELKEKIQESLVGRKRIFPLFSLSFEEFVNFKTEYRYEKKLPSFFALEKEKTFILQKITPYFKNLRKEITKSPIYYFCDLGLRNYSLGSFSDGFLFQNFVFNLLKEKYPAEKIHFWRTKNKAEIDFILETPDGPLPLETKYAHLKEVKLTRGLQSFLKKYQPKQAFIVNLSLKKTISWSKTKVHFIPFWEAASFMPL